MVNVGDYVKFIAEIINLGDDPHYCYGEVVELQSGDFFAKIKLTEDYKGFDNKVLPRYLVKKVTGSEYAAMESGIVDNKTEGCDHSWVFAGHSFYKDEKMYDCKSCGKRREDI